MKIKVKVKYIDSKKNEVIKCCNTCSNMSCRVPNYEKVGYEDDGKPAGHYCIGYLPPKTYKYKV